MASALVTGSSGLGSSSGQGHCIGFFCAAGRFTLTVRASLHPGV